MTLEATNKIRAKLLSILPKYQAAQYSTKAAKNAAVMAGKIFSKNFMFFTFKTIAAQAGFTA